MTNAIRSLPGRLLRAPIRGYQLARPGRSSPCRFVPSCSNYALEAIDTHGALRGGVLTLRRLSRCRPGGGSGVDPVPDRFAKAQAS